MPPTVPLMPAPEKAPVKEGPPTMGEILALVRDLRAEVADLKSAAAVAAPQGLKGLAPVFSKKPWEEVIYAEVMQDCTYPDLNDDYARYRKAGIDGTPGEVIRLMHREHLGKHLREITSEEAADLRGRQPRPMVPITGARGQKITHSPV